MAMINRPKNSAFSSALRQSKRRAERGVRGSMRAATRVAIPIGTLTANSQGQEATDRMPAATVGPTAAETATTKALMPMPRPSRRDG